MNGVDFIIEVDEGTEGTPSYKKIAGQRNGSLNRGADLIDTTTKDSAGWKENRPGLKEWSIDGDGLLPSDESAFDVLESAFMNGTALRVQFVTGGGTKYSGLANISDFPIEAPYEDDATYSITLQGTGPLTKV